MTAIAPEKTAPALPPWTKFAWRLDSAEPMPEGREVLFWDRTAAGDGARVVIRSDGYVFDTVSGEALDWSPPCWWSFIPPVPPAPERPEEPRG
jgi:hypothetical protein